MSEARDVRHVSRTDLAFILCAVILSALAVGSVLVAPYLPTNDGPAHILGGWWWNHLDTPGQLWSQVVIPKWPASGAAFHLPFVALEPLMGWRAATQAILVATVLLQSWGTIALGRVVHGRWHWPTLLGFVAAFGWPLYMGFFNFALATAVSIWVLAAVVRAGEVRGRTAVWLLPAFGVLAWLHLFAALGLGAALGVFVLARARPLSGLLWLALASTPVFVLVASAGGAAMHPTWHSLADVLPGAHVWSRAEVFARTILPGPWWRSELLVALVGAGALFTALRRGPDAWVGATAVAALLAALLVPFNFPGWQGFAPRFAVLGMVCGLAAAPWPARHARAAGLLTVLFAGAALTSTAALHWRLWTAYAPVLEGIAAPVQSSGYRAFVQLEPIVDNEATADAPVPLARYGIQTPALYVLAQGGVARVFHSMSMSPIEILAPAGRVFPQPLTSDGVRFGELAARVASGQAGADEVLAYAFLRRQLVHAMASYDDVIVFGARAVRAGLLSRGFDTTFDGETVALARHVGCSVSFDFGGTLPHAMPAVATTSVGPEPVLLFREGVRFELPAGQPGLAMTGVPCLDDVRVDIRIGETAPDAIICSFRGDVGAAGAAGTCRHPGGS